ncbi:MAG: ribonuclease H [Candidatus Saccharibacteria bacterium]|nr:ribonuclease H [Candidatus Saccharibacteria bacterium]
MKIVFTDGSASPNPGPGGFSVIDEESGEPIILGRSDRTTNIRMEGEAISAAMEAFSEVEIRTDSEFWKNVLERWARVWENNGWKKSRGPIQNLDLVKRLYLRYKKGGVEIVWVRGHVGTELNERADEWANNARERKTFKNLEIKEV